MNLYDFLVNVYDSFIGFFPPELQWVVTLLILLGVIGVFVAMVRHNILLIVIVIILLPFLIPVLARFIQDILNFFRHLIGILTG